MHAFVTMPFKQVPIQLQKISAVIYYEPQYKKFYKSAVLDPITAFLKQDLVRRQNIVFTEYDPSYLILQHFAQNSEINVQSLHRHLTIQQYLQFGNFSKNEQTIKKDNEKIINFLHQRVNNVLNLVESKGYHKQQMIKLKNSQESVQIAQRRQIPNVIVQILKNDIPELFLNQLIDEKFKKESFKKPVFLDTYEQQIVRDPAPKKKSAVKAKVQPVIPSNQQTLFGFMKKK